MKKRRVMIGTPCYDGRLDVWYVNSLMNTVKKAEKQNIEIIPIWVSFDALLQKARNDTVHLAMIDNVDDLIWIDSDIEWNPDWILQLLNYDVDVVGGTYPKKGDKEEYVLRRTDQTTTIDPVTGLLEVAGLGTGFVRWSRKALEYLWNTSETYIEPKDGKERKFIFNVVVENRGLISEDIWAFDLLRKGGFKIYLDPKMTCNHTGHKKWQGDFYTYFVNGNKPTWENSEEKERMSELARYSIDQRPPINSTQPERKLVQPIVPPVRQPGLMMTNMPRRQL